MADDDKTAMTLTAFEAAADAFGGDLAAWPNAERAAAEVWLAAAEQADAGAAREALRRAAWLDAALAAEATAAPSLPDAFRATLLADAESALSAQLAAQAARSAEAAPASAARGATGGLFEAAMGAIGEAFEGWRIGGVAAAAAAGLALGLIGPLETAELTAPLGEEDELALFEPFAQGGGEALDLFADGPAAGGADS